MRVADFAYGSNSGFGERNHHDRLAPKPDIDGDRHAAPAKARGASAIAPLSVRRCRTLARPGRTAAFRTIFFGMRGNEARQGAGRARWDRM
jgi:hypothetical protein